MKDKGEIIKTIKEEIPYLGIKPSSFDIIMEQLNKYDKLKGKKETDKIIEELDLDNLCWSIIQQRKRKTKMIFGTDKILL